jgi:cysteine-rich repeat protein
MAAAGHAGGGFGGTAGTFGGAASSGRSGQAGTGATAGRGSWCGDGVLDAGEQCDDGNDNDTDDCPSTCVKAYCGDGFQHDGVEACDDGNSNRGDDCSPRCGLRSDAAVEHIVATPEGTCAVSHGRELKCWGGNSSGALGLGDAQARGDGPAEMGLALPVVELGAGANVLAVAGGESHTCALLDTGVKCWGYNGDGELGLGDTQARGDAPGEMGEALATVELDGAEVLGIAAGFGFSCAFTLDAPKCWGANLAGQLGQGDVRFRGDDPGEMGEALPFASLGANVSVQALSAAGDHACAQLGNGRFKCWGSNGWGELGLGDTLPRGDGPDEMGDLLPLVDVGGASATRVAVAVNRGCAVFTAGGGVKCWGRNDAGQLGYGDTLPRGVAPGDMGSNLPTVELGTLSFVTDVALGVEHACALFGNSTVKCWGRNEHGELGYGDTMPRGGSPTDMGDNLPALDFGQGIKAITAAGHHTCVLLDDASVKCWGGNQHGELGLGDSSDRGDAPGEMGDALPSVDIGF